MTRNELNRLEAVCKHRIRLGEGSTEDARTVIHLIDMIRQMEAETAKFVEAMKKMVHL